MAFSVECAMKTLREIEAAVCPRSASMHAFPIAHVALQLTHLLTQFGVLASQFANFLLQLPDQSRQRLHLLLNRMPFQKRSTHSAPK